MNRLPATSIGVFFSALLILGLYVLLWVPDRWYESSRSWPEQERLLEIEPLIPPTVQEILHPIFIQAEKKLEPFGGSSEFIVVIDISDQKEYVFDKSGLLNAIYTISTGSSEVVVKAENDQGEIVEVIEDRSMRESIWRVSYMREEGLPALYGPRLIEMDRYEAGTWIPTNVALHGTQEPESLGQPISLGCVYHKNADIIALYDKLEIGFYVVALP